MFRALIVLVALLACSCWPAAAGASGGITFDAGLSPNRLGASTTVSFGFKLATAPTGALPSPVTSLDLHLPQGMGIVSSTLGLANCPASTLLARGLNGCSPNARIGFGDALVEVPFGPGTLTERLNVDTLIGAPNKEHTEVVFYITGQSPVLAQLVFSGSLLNDSGVYGGRLQTSMPLTPTLPDAPDVSIISFHSTIGPSHLLYEERVHGRVVRYRPKGMREPRTCPANGFAFRADLTFADGSHSTVSTAVRCPSK